MVDQVEITQEPQVAVWSLAKSAFKTAWRWVREVLAMLFVVGVVAILGYLAIFVLALIGCWRTIVLTYGLVKLTIYKFITFDLTPVWDEEQNIRPEKPIIREAVVDTIEDLKKEQSAILMKTRILTQYLNVLNNECMILFEALGVVGIIAVLITLISLVYLIRAIRFKDMYYRSVKRYHVIPESALPGSPLIKDCVPTFQVALKKERMFGSDHIGYALRVAEEILIVPGHVWEKFRGERSIILEGPKGKAVMSYKQGRTASFVEDLVFITVNKDSLSSIGVTKGKLSEQKLSGLTVTVSGFNGKETTMSNGIIKPNRQFPDKYSYTGSTLAGFSGAAYSIGNTIYAMHVWGAAGNHTLNYGIASKAIALELRYLAVEEDTNGEMMRSYFTTEQPKQKDYYAELKAALASQGRENELWADEVDANIALESAKPLSPALRGVIGTVSALSAEDQKILMEAFGATLTVEAQNNEGNLIEVQGRSLITRVEDLENEADVVLDSVRDELKGFQSEYDKFREYVATTFEEIKLTFIKVEGRISTVEADQVDLRENGPVEQKDKINKLEERISEQDKKVKLVFEQFTNRAVQPTQSVQREPEVFNKIIRCPQDGCNRLFATIAAARQHMATAPRHQVDNNATLVAESIRSDNVVAQGKLLFYKESAQKSDYEQRVRQKQDFLERPGPSQSRRRRNWVPIFNTSERRRQYTQKPQQ